MLADLCGQGCSRCLRLGLFHFEIRGVLLLELLVNFLLQLDLAADLHLNWLSEEAQVIPTICMGSDIVIIRIVAVEARVVVFHLLKLSFLG